MSPVVAQALQDDETHLPARLTQTQSRSRRPVACCPLRPVLPTITLIPPSATKPPIIQRLPDAYAPMSYLPTVTHTTHIIQPIYQNRIIAQPIFQIRYAVQPVYLQRRVFQPISRPVRNETVVQPVLLQRHFLVPFVVEQPLIQQQFHERDDYIQMLNGEAEIATPAIVPMARGHATIQVVKVPQSGLQNQTLTNSTSHLTQNAPQQRSQTAQQSDTTRRSGERQ